MKSLSFKSSVFLIESTYYTYLLPNKYKSSRLMKVDARESLPNAQILQFEKIIQKKISSSKTATIRILIHCISHTSIIYTNDTRIAILAHYIHVNNKTNTLQNFVHLKIFCQKWPCNKIEIFCQSPNLHIPLHQMQNKINKQQ